MKITPEQAKTILDANTVNLARKVKNGQSLSAGEIAVLEALSNSTPDAPVQSVTVWAKNQVELAKVIGVDRKTIQRWLKEPDNPGRQADNRYSVAAWREFARARGHEVGGSDADEVDERRERARNVLLQNMKLEVQLKVLRKEYVPALQVEKWGAELGAAIRKVVCQIHLAAPDVVGMTAPDAEARLKELEDEIIQQLHLLAENFKGLEIEAEQEQEPAAGESESEAAE